MAHFARIKDGIVVDIQALVNDVITEDGVEVEEVGQEFLTGLFGGEWVQTSYNGSFRKNYAAVGFTYDKERDAFIPPKEWDSWALDEETCRWVSPVPMPETGGPYYWNEDSLVWVGVEDEAV
jgi:hypothetical protein